MTIDTSSKVLIVGAGCFGLSTAYHLLKRGFQDVVVLDRATTLPAQDAASCDMNKIVRSSYSDNFYARLAKDAIDEWKNTAQWGDTYHECGVVVLGVGTAAYSDNALSNDIALGSRVEKLADSVAIRKAFPGEIATGSFQGSAGYLNKDGGWAYASQGITKIQSEVESLGGKVLPGKSATSLLKQDDRTSGVICQDGTEYSADIVVLASGAWTASTFPELDLQEKCLATGQSVAFIQLTPEEGEKYSRCPVYLDFSSGFYCFPPNKDNIVKMAIHCAGHTFVDPSSAPGISTPRTSLSHGDDGLRIPKSGAKALRDNLRLVYPELAKKPFADTRICWYTDSPDDDWIIGYHPTDSGLVFATAGSGHAYKFLPNIGHLVADAIEGKLDPEVRARFAVDRQKAIDHVSRVGQVPVVLEVDELCTAKDLLP